MGLQYGRHCVQPERYSSGHLASRYDYRLEFYNRLSEGLSLCDGVAMWYRQSRVLRQHLEELGYFDQHHGHNDNNQEYLHDCKHRSDKRLEQQVPSFRILCSPPIHRVNKYPDDDGNDRLDCLRHYHSWMGLCPESECLCNSCLQ